jgi:hypothetical protein
MMIRRSVLLLGVGLALSGCTAHFSCAGWDELPELKTARTDDPRTKRVVLKWRTYAREMGCKFK